eukprot:1156822-Pelagomonas_calceolata.AAC.5
MLACARANATQWCHSSHACPCVMLVQGPVSEGVEDLQLQPSKPSTSAANGAAALQGPPQATALQPRSKVNFNLGNTHSEDLDPYLQHPLRVSTSNAHFNLQGLEAPQLTRAQGCGTTQPTQSPGQLSSLILM